MYQSWRELLFLHWDFPAEQIQATLPPGLYVDTFDGKAWLGIVPFWMRDIHPRWFPTVPGISNFLELNLRTYVHDNRGNCGVWFYSLDANQSLAVWAARRFFHLNYQHAVMTSARDNATGWTGFSSQRRGASADLNCQFRYRSISTPRPAEPGSFEFFLVERYVLFARSPLMSGHHSQCGLPLAPREGEAPVEPRATGNVDSRERLGRSLALPMGGEARVQLYTGTVVHEPYQISEVELPQWSDSLLPLNGFARPGRPPVHAAMCRGVDVDIYPLVRPSS